MINSITKEIKKKNQIVPKQGTTSFFFKKKKKLVVTCLSDLLIKFHLGISKSSNALLKTFYNYICKVFQAYNIQVYHTGTCSSYLLKEFHLC